nr:MAG TPA: hypothetical protein [Caudoviricetes sp.]
MGSASRREFNRFNHNIINRKGQGAQESVFLPVFCWRTIIIERKGVGNMRVRLYIHSN